MNIFTLSLFVGLLISYSQKAKLILLLDNLDYLSKYIFIIIIVGIFVSSGYLEFNLTEANLKLNPILRCILGGAMGISMYSIVLLMLNYTKQHS